MPVPVSSLSLSLAHDLVGKAERKKEKLRIKIEKRKTKVRSVTVSHEGAVWALSHGEVVRPLGEILQVKVDAVLKEPKSDFDLRIPKERKGKRRAHSLCQGIQIAVRHDKNVHSDDDTK